VNHSDKAEALFHEGYNCAQATAAAFAEDYGLEASVVLRSTAGFGGGMGGLRETCGAVSAIVYVAGLHAGAFAPGDIVAKTALYDLVKRMIHDFQAQHETTVCRELLEKASCVPAADPSQRSPEYYATRPCARLVASAAEIIERTLSSSPRQS
jgi:C_GCAxxG_C_C family probable redox protein